MYGVLHYGKNWKLTFNDPFTVSLFGNTKDSLEDVERWRSMCETIIVNYTFPFMAAERYRLHYIWVQKLCDRRNGLSWTYMQYFDYYRNLCMGGINKLPPYVPVQNKKWQKSKCLNCKNGYCTDFVEEKN